MTDRQKRVKEPKEREKPASQEIAALTQSKESPALGAAFDAVANMNNPRKN
jgi:hypothetical protein